MSSVDIFGVNFQKQTMNEAIDKLQTQVETGTELFHVVTANPEFVMRAMDDKEFMNTLNHANMITPDGIGVVIASRIFKNPLPERIPGFDMVNGWFKKGKPLKVFMVGSKEHVVKKASEFVSNTYPNVTVCGIHDGYFSNNDSKELHVVEMIKQERPDLLLVALGCPKQEEFIQRYKKELPVKVAIGVGGSFDVWAGEVKRAPKAMQKLGLEWFYRLIKQPTRWKRQLSLGVFILKVFKHRKKEGGLA